MMIVDYPRTAKLEARKEQLQSGFMRLLKAFNGQIGMDQNGYRIQDIQDIEWTIGQILSCTIYEVVQIRVETY